MLILTKEWHKTAKMPHLHESPLPPWKVSSTLVSDPGAMPCFPTHILLNLTFFLFLGPLNFPWMWSGVFQNTSCINYCPTDHTHLRYWPHVILNAPKFLSGLFQVYFSRFFEVLMVRMSSHTILALLKYTYLLCLLLGRKSLFLPRSALIRDKNNTY